MFRELRLQCANSPEASRAWNSRFMSTRRNTKLHSLTAARTPKLCSENLKCKKRAKAPSDENLISHGEEKVFEGSENIKPYTMAIWSIQHTWCSYTAALDAQGGTASKFHGFAQTIHFFSRCEFISGRGWAGLEAVPQGWTDKATKLGSKGHLPRNGSEVV